VSGAGPTKAAGRPRLPALLLTATLAAAIAVPVARPAPAAAASLGDRLHVGGYFRIMSRPDLQGGQGTLGFWNLYGRLLNEGPWAALELKLDLLEPHPEDVWTSVHFKVEGGSVMGADIRGGSLEAFRLTQLYARAGNVGLRDVVWQIGTLDTWMGDLGLYDMKPAQIFFETVGMSAQWRHRSADLLLGFGDSGFFVRGTQYSPILTAGGLLRVRPVRGLELGGGGQVGYEPRVERGRYAPHTTPDVQYEDYVRRRVVEAFVEENPGQQDLFHRQRPPSATENTSFKLVGYLGFGGFGPLQWNNLFANFLRRHPENFYVEQFGGRDYVIYVAGLTDERYQINVGNEMLLTLVPGRLDAAWAVLFGRHWDDDNAGVIVSEDDRTFYSTVLRLQGYLTETIHLLAETSVAREISENGFMWREHWDSVFATPPDTFPMQYGDTDRRDTLQIKAGPVLNPKGFGIWSRPSLRLLYGAQRSNVHDAFTTSVIQSLDQFDQFGGSGVGGTSRHWHHVIALEAEAWF
jgi:hypothetical protein